MQSVRSHKVFAVAYSVAQKVSPALAVRPKQSRKHWFTRFVTAMMESRLRAARREIAMYANVIDLERRHGDLGPRKDDLPFGGAHH